jgi:hypothetical protein
LPDLSAITCRCYFFFAPINNQRIAYSVKCLDLHAHLRHTTAAAILLGRSLWLIAALRQTVPRATQDHTPDFGVATIATISGTGAPALAETPTLKTLAKG